MQLACSEQDLDLIISQKEATMYGVPIQVYFFSRNKIWKEYERIQSDIFDHLLAMVPKFDLKVYQYSDWTEYVDAKNILKHSHSDENFFSLQWEKILTSVKMILYQNILWHCFGSFNQ